ncbi:translation initiation factor eIF-5A family protein, putative, partial (macronuclear) [Tetrahymena thermophila SB210]
QNEIEDEGVSAICIALCRCKLLMNLKFELCNIQIGNEGAYSFEKVLSSCKSLINLKFSL